ncbi:AIR synthase family protein [Natronobiforma cellulositropha]|uniref:AIR synthase family protein n=1 Tax=Natronobiforma cellulositropha TaxID=1679076 RepID=UPI0021D5E975|nr:AIR synthase family protein [Natronobiforma cellulositropha]
MTQFGKIDRAFFDERIAPNLGGVREDVAVGPAHGIDFGVIDVGGRTVAIATDPLSILPALGFERAARFALDLVLADVAVSAIAPTHLSVCFTLPPEMTDEQFATVWETIHAECRDLGVAVVTGHTARYSDCSYPWVGAATVLGVGDPEQVVRPDGARPGDRLLVTTGPGAETVGLLATLFADELELSEATLSAAQERLEDVYCVRDALTAAAAGPVRAMHDVTEGGLAGALCEMADGAGVRFEIDRAAVPVKPGVEAVCTHLEIDPWSVTSCGSLVLAVAPEGVDAVREALSSRGTLVAEVGRVDAGSGVVVDGEPLSHPETDPAWDAYADLLERRER